MSQLDHAEKYKDRIIKDLQGLIKIRSVDGERKEGRPFGDGVHEALMYMLDKGKELGLTTKNIDNYAGHIEIGEGEEIVGVLVHLDIVAEGSGWDMDPFGGEIIDGKLFGRGAVDNKGPAIVSLYALKTIVDAGIKLHRRVRLILGTNEETAEWGGINYYIQKEEMPHMAFVPDGEFPVIQGEKGILIFDLVKKIGLSTETGIKLKSIEGGNAPNMVPDFCKAVLIAKDYRPIMDAIEQFNKERDYSIKYKMQGKGIQISAAGVSAHGSTPEKGINAISIMIQFLGKLTFDNDSIQDFIKFYNDKIGMDIHGERIGCYFKDDISGELIFNLGQIKVDEKTIGMTVNIRAPLHTDMEDIYAGIRSVIDEHSFGIIKKHYQGPIYLESDHPVIKALMKVYQKHTQDYESKPKVIGGGTYARAIENAVAFGPRLVDGPSVEHQKNEYIEIEHLMTLFRIYTDAILELANETEG
ncbi:MAG: dipeptidase PepV [Peptostreptococcales bacterium]